MNKRYNKRYNNLFTSNYYTWGGDFKDALKDALNFKDAFNGANIANAVTDLAGSVGSVVGNATNSIISGGLESGAGSTINNIGQGLGSLVSKINPLLGGAVSAASGIISGGVNKLFGSNLNQENINDIRNINNALNTVMVGGNNEDILGQWSTQDMGDAFNKSDIGKDGTFSNKASNMYKQLKRERAAAQNRMLTAYDDAITSADTESDLALLANYSKYGGPIKIKPSKRGTFTAAANKRGMEVQEFASKVLANKEDYSSAMVKKANFAKNAANWKHKLGGNLFTNNVTIIGNGNSHEENPYKGVQMGVDSQGIPNLVEEGEVVFNDFVYSDSIKASKEMKKRYKLKGNTIADIAKYVQKESEERPNDPISKRGLEDIMSKIAVEQEAIKEEKTKGNKYNNGGLLGFKEIDLRYAPILGSAIGLGQTLFSKPDYSNAENIEDAAIEAGKYTPIDYNPISNYLQYNPLDRNYYSNRLTAESGATRRAIANTINPSRNAALLAADYNAQRALGDFFRQAEEYDLAQRAKVEEFNRGTNQANSQMAMQAALANQQAKANADRARLSGIAQAAAMRDEIDNRRAASLSANLTGLFDNLGNLGIDAMNRADRDFYIKHVMGANLPLEEYRRLYGLDAAKKEAKKRGFTDNEITKLFKNGGQLKKKRGGFTY